MTQRTLVLVSALCAILLLPATPLAATRTFEATTSRTWDPVKRTIHKGDRIKWTNPTTGTHTVTAYGGNWSMNKTLSAGDVVKRRFRRTGTFRFRCTLLGHSSLTDGVCSGMCGRVRVRT